MGSIDEVMKTIIELFLPPLSISGRCIHLDVGKLREGLSELLIFVKVNSDCFCGDFVLKLVLSTLCDKRRAIHADHSMYPTTDALSCEIYMNEVYATYCCTITQCVLAVLRLLAERDYISFSYSDSDNGASDLTPVQKYRNFNDSSDREWRSIRLHQAACIQLFKLNHAIVLSDLVKILSSLSTLQIVPYYYWSQAIKICDESKAWDDLELILQVTYMII